jgi:peptidoglycan/xylan/chitin deacetylase (PgdA/CDA1 family)
MLAALSIDIDETHHYRAIHGLPPSEEAAHAAYDVAIERAVDFARRLGASLTLFAVGRDLDRPENADRLRDLARKGHAIESHSMSHRYDLVEASESAMRREIVDSLDIIENVTGRRPVGFRAPGYTVSTALFDAIEGAGLAFDSSVFPCPAYFAAKAAVMGAMALVGRSSASVVGSPRVLVAPTEPYRPGRSVASRGRRSFVEIPIRVTRGPRLPVIGTSIALGGELGARALVAACRGVPFFNVELHAMDFLDASDGLADLAPHQPELRRPIAARLRALAAFGAALRDRGYRFVTLAEMAGAVCDDERSAPRRGTS